jgi:GR25 family glycosyltransferase involved in LPS biosynthesis
MHHFNLLFIFLVCAAVAHADLEEYLKKTSDKSGMQSIRNIDFIYMINLDERPEKCAQTMQRLAPWGIIPYRFSAVNGWDLSLELLNDVGVKFGFWMQEGKWGTCYLPEQNGIALHEQMCVPGRNYFSHCMSRGAVGIALSHLSILQDAYDSGYKTIWVMEDDIDVIRDPHVLSDLIDELDSVAGKTEWDILFTDLDTKGNDNKRVPCTSYAFRPNFTPANPQRFAKMQIVSPNLRRIGARYGAYSLIVRRSGMKKILDFFNNYQIFLPFDMEYTQPDDIRLYTVLNDVVSTQINSPSDNGAPNYKNKEQ